MAPLPANSDNGRPLARPASSRVRSDSPTPIAQKENAMKQEVADLIGLALRHLQTTGTLPAEIAPDLLKIDHTKDKSHGDFASNIALALAKPAKSSPRALAEKIVAALPPSQHIAKVEIAGPGFINFFLAAGAQTAVVNDIIDTAEKFGRSNIGGNKKVQVEFVSANPTGPLHVGHGRGAAVGDCLCRLLDAAGWDVTREFYYNDAGAQIDNLALSVQVALQGRDAGRSGLAGKWLSRRLHRRYRPRLSGRRNRSTADYQHVHASGDIE